MMHLPHRQNRRRHRVAALTLALSALPLVLLPAAALATTDPGPKAAIEHAERQAAGPTHPTKAQIEHREAQPPAPARHTQQPQSGSTGDAALWQLAISAGLGAALTGAVVVTSRRVGQHHHHVATS
jgi:uncharacterized protein HemX